MAQAPDFSPEYSGKTLCPELASACLAPSVIAFLNREKIFGIALGEEVKLPETTVVDDVPPGSLGPAVKGAAANR